MVDKVAKATRLNPDKLTFIYAPTQSLAGTTQIVARSLEVALHKANDLKFPLDNIVDGIASAPLPAPHPDFLVAMGRTNDAIIYGGLAQLFVTGPADAARALAEKLPSRTSRDYGKPFAEIFKQFKGDFYAIDPLLFSPAEAIVTADRDRRDVSRGWAGYGTAGTEPRLGDPAHSAPQRQSPRQRADRGAAASWRDGDHRAARSSPVR